MLLREGLRLSWRSLTHRHDSHIFTLPKSQQVHQPKTGPDNSHAQRCPCSLRHSIRFPPVIITYDLAFSLSKRYRAEHPETEGDRSKSGANCNSHKFSKSALELRARVRAFLKSINFTPGADVQKGNLRFVIELEPHQVTVDQAKVEGIV
jgi:hypothetical protein